MDAERARPPGMAQGGVALLPGAAANGMDDQFHASSVCQTGQFRRPVLAAVVDRFVQAAFLEECVLAAAGGTEDPRTDMTRDVNGSETDAAARVVDQHRFVGG